MSPVGRIALALAAAAAAWSPGLARAQAFSVLVVQASAEETLVSVGGSQGAATARVQVSVPAGFTLNLARPVGAVVGRGDLELESASDPGGEGSSTLGDIVVADPARYAADPRLQACAAGTHLAVWRVEPLDVPVFVDAATGPDAALGGYELKVCFDLPEGLAFSGLGLDLARTVVPPTAPGIYVWRAFITPMTATGAVDEGATFEVRGLVPWPSVLTLHSRRAKAKGRYVLYGKLLLARKPRRGATIRIVRFTQDSSGSATVTFTLGQAQAAETSRTGGFRIPEKVTRATVFYAFWLPFPREGCSSPSTAPGGCLTETTSPVISGRVVVKPRR